MDILDLGEGGIASGRCEAKKNLAIDALLADRVITESWSFHKKQVLKVLIWDGLDNRRRRI